MNVSVGEICSSNAEQFRFDHYSAKPKLQSVVPLASFTKKKQRCTVIWFGKQISWPFNRSPKKQKHIPSILKRKFLCTFT